MKTFAKLSTIVLLACTLASAAGVQMGSVQFMLPIKGGHVFVLAFGEPVVRVTPCYTGSGFCWDTSGLNAGFHLYKQATGTKFDGTIGAISVVDTGAGCSQVSFPITNGTFVLGTNTLAGLRAWYTQTLCTVPSGFMGGGSLLIHD